MNTSGHKRIAERYVRALFEAAQAAGATDEVEKDLASLGRALDESAEFRHFLANPLLTTAQRAQTLLALLDRIGVSQLTRQFLGMVVRQKRLPALPAIISEFARAAAAARGELDARIITAAPLKDRDIAALSERLSRAYGRRLRLEVTQDPALLGGLILKIGSQQLDGSLAGKMRRLKHTLKAA